MTEATNDVCEMCFRGLACAEHYQPVLLEELATWRSRAISVGCELITSERQLRTAEQRIHDLEETLRCVALWAEKKNTPMKTRLLAVTAVVCKSLHQDPEEEHVPE